MRSVSPATSWGAAQAQRTRAAANPWLALSGVLVNCVYIQIYSKLVTRKGNYRAQLVAGLGFVPLPVAKIDTGALCPVSKGTQADKFTNA